MEEKIKKIILKIIILILSIIFIYLLVDGKNLYVDMYNFKQLEKAKIILDNIPETNSKFYNLSDFNKKYGAEIKPIKNCYTVSNNNGKYPYYFGFKLESKFLNLLYQDGYYVYPGYDIEVVPLCIGLSIGKPGEQIGCKKKKFSSDFIYTIINPCEKN
ncbi:MAG: hypothetical protein PHH98_02045 [Candidatus Gracilibacteria bacterium]|nr:hypothetical protein [Candidatus Gracilibacteria bacterium]